MKLTDSQLLKVKQTIILPNGNKIVRIDVSENMDISPLQSSSNIYCISQSGEIVWQVKEVNTTRPFEDDMFVYLKENERNEILADRFSGFEYKINPENGEAEQIGFHK